ncbi:caffeoylshikimate esterase isoform X1 [Brassica rapa]|uniref:caffeoylshikimate esterase isoform X1 n=1 Tax=Brassica campestris TaxID=3711 RepID=UPI00142DB9E9|nr:caffeoylshikimate esterase isoform X1 [Brassica rapa]
MQLLTCKWFPVNQEPRALIFFCHGYAIDCSTTFKDVASKFAKEGFGVYGIEYEGHGRSGGLNVYIDDFDLLINDVYSHFSKIAEMGENPKKKKFLMGESMGGAVVLLLHRKKPEFWEGAILIAPMCKVNRFTHIITSSIISYKSRIINISNYNCDERQIAEEMKPPKPVISMMNLVIHLIPSWKSILPGPDIINLAIKQPHKRQEIKDNPNCYIGRPRMKTMSELFRVSLDLENRLHEVTMPFIVLHGEDDKVTDKEASKLLYEVASSNDKTLKLYPEMWHSLLFGEPLEKSEIVFNDIVQWMETRINTLQVNANNNHEAKSQI